VTAAVRLAVLVSAVALLSGCGGATVERLTVSVVAQHPHDPQAFTQGLVWRDGALYESTGLFGASSLRETTVDGEVVRYRPLARDLFGEGLALVGEELLQLTWQNGLLLRYDLATFEPRGSQSYEGEGWGLCFDGQALWMSDGSATLTRRDPLTFAALSSVTVKRGTTPVTQLNELECVDGLVYANVWKSDEIMRIDSKTGAVTAVIDGAPLRRLMGAMDSEAVLNGIAFMQSTGNFLLTGKLWPTLFEVKFVAR
jgi:glutamine cyclotransferase